jgi:hypothetical protein
MMNRRTTLALALFTLYACADASPVAEPAKPMPEIVGVGLTGIRGALMASSPAILDPTVEVPEAPVQWVFSPPELQVFRATAVHLTAAVALADRPKATCRWNFGDGSPTVEGCDVSHTFHGGQADQLVTLNVTDGAWSNKSTRTLPLERLPVDPTLGEKEALVGEAAGNALPNRPALGASNLRIAIVADSAAQGGVHADVSAAVEQIIETVRPGLVVHAGGLVTAEAKGQEWEDVRSAMVEPLERASIPMVTALSPADKAAGAKIPATRIQLLDGAHYPERYTFTSQGAFFLVFGSGTDGVSEDTIRWMRDQLGQSRIYEARYVISHLPLHKFGDLHVGSLDKRFRLYEIFLRSRVTALFSAGYRVYFKGRYGALPVVSVGSLAGPGGALSGVDFEQPSSFVVVDQIDGVPERIFAVAGPDFTRTFDESNLPENVEVYTR